MKGRHLVVRHDGLADQVGGHFQLAGANASMPMACKARGLGRLAPGATRFPLSLRGDLCGSSRPVQRRQQGFSPFIGGIGGEGVLGRQYLWRRQ